MWDLIVSVPDHCLSFYLTVFNIHVRVPQQKINICSMKPELIYLSPAHC